MVLVEPVARPGQEKGREGWGGLGSHTRTHTLTHTFTHTCLVGYSLWLWWVRVLDEEEEGWWTVSCLIVDLDCLLQVSVATSLWSFVEVVQP